MIVYGLCVFLFLFIWILLKESNKKIALTLFGIVIFLLMGLRHSSVGTDTAEYCKDYFNCQNIPLIQLLKDNSKFGRANFLYLIFCKAIGILFPESYTPFLLAVSACVVIAIVKFTIRFSKDYFFTFIVLFSLGYIFFFMTGIKQSLAMAAGLMAFIALADNKLFKFIFWVVVATLFHNTAIIVLIVLPFYRLKWKKLYIIIVPIMVIVATIFKSQITSFIINYLGESKYSIYGTEKYTTSNNIMGLLIQLTCFSFVLFCMWREFKKENKDFECLLAINVIGIFFQCLVLVIAEFFRMSMYFSIVSVALVPNALEETSVFVPKTKSILKVLIIFVFLLYFIISNVDNTNIINYLPYWGK